MSIEAMKQALEALEYPLNTSNEGFDVNMAELLAHRAITSLRQAIAEAEKQVTYTGNGTVGREADVNPTGFFFQMPKAEKQEPVVGTKTWFEDGKVVTQNLYASDIYTSPPQRQPLTDEQVRDIAKQYALSLAFPYDSKTTPEMFARAIEAAHGIKEKNT